MTNMLSQIAKAAAQQIAHQEKIEQAWQDAKDCIETAQWLLETAKGTPTEQAMLDILENAKKAEREAYNRVKAISAESRSLFNHYADKLSKKKKA